MIVLRLYLPGHGWRSRVIPTRALQAINNYALRMISEGAINVTTHETDEVE